MEKKEPCALWVGMQIGSATLQNNLEVSKKTKNRTTIWSRNHTSGYISHSHVHCRLFTIAKILTDFVIAQCFLYHNLLFCFITESSSSGYEQGSMSLGLKGGKTTPKSCVIPFLFLVLSHFHAPFSVRLYPGLCTQSVYTHSTLYLSVALWTNFNLKTTFFLV